MLTFIGEPSHAPHMTPTDGDLRRAMKIVDQPAPSGKDFEWLLQFLSDHSATILKGYQKSLDA